MKINTVELYGMQGAIVSATAERAPGEWLTVCGMQEATARESRVRTRSALSQVDPDLDVTDVRVTMSPAGRGEGAFDLAVALAAMDRVNGSLANLLGPWISDTVFVGGLSLRGELRPVRGIIARLTAAREAGFVRAVVPAQNGNEAARVDGIEVLLAESLCGVLDWLRSPGVLLHAATPPAAPPCGSGVDLSEVKACPLGRRALEVAAAGGHNLLLLGSAGSGKTMLARRLPGILPPMTDSEAVVVSAIHSSAGILPDTGWMHARPFRAPHHTVSEAGLIGGGDPPRPGEVSLAHGGVLFLDELAEFRRSNLDALASSLRDGEVVIKRQSRYARFPARPLIVAASNLCPCGREPCECGNRDWRRTYMDRLMTGPLAATFDLVVRLPKLDLGDLRHVGPGESTRVVQQRVVDARLCLDRVLDQVQPCGDQPSKVRGVARTLAALDGRELISSANVEEARVLCGMDG